jgi:hypothetical protein
MGVADDTWAWRGLAVRSELTVTMSGHGAGWTAREIGSMCIGMIFKRSSGASLHTKAGEDA